MRKEQNGMESKKKYYLNENTGRLHIIGKCCHTKHLPPNAKCFATEDEAISSETRFMSYCKKCFKEK